MADPWPRRLLLRAAYGLGWHLGPRLGPRTHWLLARTAARLAVRRPGVHVEQFRANLTAATGAPVTDDVVRAGVESYLRNMLEVFALPGWSHADVRRRVVTVNEDVLRTAFAGPGAVVALPHSGNWDLAGAWACATGMPVTTVAEALTGPELTTFTRFRRGLGMEVLVHTDRDAIPALAGAIRSGRLVCLMADRDLVGSGLPVSWAGRPVTLPAGPALVARRTGATLIPAVCQFTATGMRIVFGAAVPAQPGRVGLTAMTQQVADFFAARIAEQPEDWHLMQPFFTARPAVDPIAAPR